MTTNSDHSKLYTAAVSAGFAALRAARVQPMLVGYAVGLSDQIDETKPTYFVEDGACGFAWVNIKPGTSSFAKWLVAQGFARRDSYYGGVTVWVKEGNQSMQKKEAFAHAFARVLSDAGIRAYAASRMD